MPRSAAGSLVAYSRQMKVDDLAVPEALLDAEGSVSLRVTLAMAQAAQRRAAVGLALTGLAGPAGDLSDIGSSPMADIPVGRVYLVCLHQDKTYRKTCDYAGTRQEIRLAAVADALDMLLSAGMSSLAAASTGSATRERGVQKVASRKKIVRQIVWIVHFFSVLKTR